MGRQKEIDKKTNTEKNSENEGGHGDRERNTTARPEKVTKAKIGKGRNKTGRQVRQIDIKKREKKNRYRETRKDRGQGLRIVKQYREKEANDKKEHRQRDARV